MHTPLQKQSTVFKMLPVGFSRRTLPENTYLSRYYSSTQTVFLVPLCLTPSPSSRALHLHSQQQECFRCQASAQAKCPEKAEHSSVPAPTRLLAGLCLPSSSARWERHKLMFTEASVSGLVLPEQTKADISFVGDQAGASSWILLQAAPNPKRLGLGHYQAAWTNIIIIWSMLNNQYSC